MIYEPWATTSWATTPPGKMVFGGNTWCGIYGEPVNTATGNFYFEAGDLSLAGVGPVIGLARTYNHQDAAKNGTLGYGWTLSSDSSMQVDETGTVTVIYPGGSRKDFTPDGLGGFVTPAGTLETLRRNVDTTYDLITSDQQVLHFASNNLLSTVTDRNGNTVTYVRDGLGNLTDITGSGGRAIHLTYSAGHVASASDNAGRSVTYGHNAAGDLTSVTDVTGNTTTFAYDSQHRVTSVASPKHPTTPFVTNVYDADNRVTTQFDGYGNQMSFAYDSDSTVITDNRGGTLTHIRGSDFRLLSAVDAAGNAESRTYNSDGLVDSLTDGRGKVSHMTYDANGNETSATDPAGHGVSAGYDLANNNMLWAQDALGRRTDYSYDASGTNLLSVAGPVNSVAYDYYANGLVHHSASAGATITFEFTSAGLPSRIIDPLGHSSDFRYDAAARVTGVTDAMGRSVETSLDAAGRTTRIADALGHYAAFAYDANGNQISASDARSKTTSYTYDTMDKLVGVTDALNGHTGYTYDENYNLASVTNARSVTTSYTYTANDLLEAVADPLSRTWVFEHDAAGNLTETTFPSGAAVTRTYTDDELLHSLSAGPLTYTFDYSPTHEVTDVTDDSGRAWTRAYDDGDRLVSSTDGNDPYAAFVVTRSYDAAGNVSGIRASAEDTRTYVYDLAGRLTSLALPSEVTSHTTYAYDDAGLLTGRTLPDGSAATWSYDAAGRLSSITETVSTGVLGFDYTRDENGNVTVENDTRYGYDALNRLTTWYDPSADATTTYEYDGAFNLTGVSVDGSVTTSFAFDAADRISSPGFAYDADGNMTSDGSKGYTYDALNRLTEVRDSTGTVIASYAYDASNRRVSSTDASGTIYFHYDGASPNVIAETDGDGGTIATYAYDAAGGLHSMSRDGESYFYHANGHGDVITLTDANGDVVNSYSYDPWGRVLTANETVSNPYRYAGYRYDEGTGLYHLWNRYYSPATMRFITKDLYPGEIRNPGTMNGYVYCLGNPVNALDPSGFALEWLVIGVVLVLALVAVGAYVHYNYPAVVNSNAVRADSKASNDSMRQATNAQKQTNLTGQAARNAGAAANCAIISDPGDVASWFWYYRAGVKMGSFTATGTPNGAPR